MLTTAFDCINREATQEEETLCEDAINIEDDWVPTENIEEPRIVLQTRTAVVTSRILRSEHIMEFLQQYVLYLDGACAVCWMDKALDGARVQKYHELNNCPLLFQHRACIKCFGRGHQFRDCPLQA